MAARLQMRGSSAWLLLGLALVACTDPGISPVEPRPEAASERDIGRADAEASPPAAAPDQTETGPSQPGTAPDPAPLHGRLEEHSGLRLLRLWGTPEQRGYAHGRLLGGEITTLLRAEYEFRFARREALLTTARASLGRMIAYPEEHRREIEALYEGLVDAGTDLSLPTFSRDIDLDDLLLVNAMDVIALMGCSGFTAWGDQVEGGGVLTGRNFDWPFSGAHMIDSVLVLVQHLPDGAAVASVTWPGFVGSVTAVNSAGTAAFLHVGNGKVDPTPEPDSYPTAIAARAILERIGAGDAEDSWEVAEGLLDYTSPPVGFITRVVLPHPPPAGEPVGVFEVDANRVVQAAVRGATVITNHFQWRPDGRGVSKDSADRLEAVRTCLDDCLTSDDKAISPVEGWDLLARVDRGGKAFFGTLHSLVYRADPWFFELRVGTWNRERGLVPATKSERRFVLRREQLFPARAPGRR